MQPSTCANRLFYVRKQYHATQPLPIPIRRLITEMQPDIVSRSIQSVRVVHWEMTLGQKNIISVFLNVHSVCQVSVFTTHHFKYDQACAGARDLTDGTAEKPAK